MSSKKNQPQWTSNPWKTLIEVPIEEELQQSYLDYALSVIIGRAIPDVRDGLKPVQRRILYSMHENGLTHDRPYRKSARIVGDVLGKYHPHGDAPVYDALVRMAQPFNFRYPLIDGQGNFGSIDGDAPAAMRYTEARMSALAEELLRDIDKDTVDFVPNFDETLKEPMYLPAAFPNFLVNGSSGIAVAIASEIPPHNLGEVIDAIEAYMKNPRISVDELLKYVKGPDFPTGGEIVVGSGGEELRKVYSTGRGRFVVRGRVKLEKGGRRKRIVIYEIPYQVKKAELIHQIALESGLIKDEKSKEKRKPRIVGVKDVRDESDKEVGLRVVVEIGADVDENVVLNQLYKYTSLQKNYWAIMIGVHRNRPVLLDLKRAIQIYVDHRRDIVTRRTRYLLRKAEERAHILEGLIIAQANIDEVVAIIKSSKNPSEAKARLTQKFELTQKQAQAILEMRLQQLTSLEVEKLKREYEELLKKIEYYRSILSSPAKRDQVVIDELEEIKKKYADERRTAIVYEEVTLSVAQEDLIHQEDIVVPFSEKFVRRVLQKSLSSQGRGGKGSRVMRIYENDSLRGVLRGTTHDFYAFFSNRGKMFMRRGFDISQEERGESFLAHFALAKDEKILSGVVLPQSVQKRQRGCFILFFTRKGFVKKMKLSEIIPSSGKLSHLLGRKGIQAIGLDSDDELVKVIYYDREESCGEVMMLCQDGRAIRFDAKSIRAQGRTARGVSGMDCRAVSDAFLLDDNYLFLATASGKAKVVRASEFPLRGRGGKGVKAFQINKGDSLTAGVSVSYESEKILAVSSEGDAIMVEVKEVPLRSRASGGVILSSWEAPLVALLRIENGR